VAFLGQGACALLAEPAGDEGALQPASAEPEGAPSDEVVELRRRVIELEVALADARAPRSVGLEAPATPSSVASAAWVQARVQAEVEGGPAVPPPPGGGDLPTVDELNRLLASQEDPEAMATLWVWMASIAGDDAQLVARYLDRALQLDPDASVYEAIGELEDGAVRLEVLEILTQRHSGADEVWGLLAQSLDAEADPDRVMAAFQRAYELDPDDEEWFDEMVGVDLAAARAAVERVSALHPDDPTVWTHLSRLYMAEENERLAADAMVRSLSLREAGEDISDLLEGLSNFEPERAVALLDRMLQANPRDARIWAVQAGYHSMAGNGQLAKEALRQAMTLDPEGSYDEQLLAIDPASAVDHLGRRIQGDPEAASDDEVWGDLGDAHVALDQLEQALRCYQEAKRLDPEDEEWTDSLASVRVRLAAR
jgi:cytochrome c-type biogenesis protein CcmH/NrfG